MATHLHAQLQETLGSTYRLERELGRGAMACVYLACDRKHDRRVALKVLHPELAASLGAERFLREIHIAAQLSHPHILPLHDSGAADGLLYYVAPYVEGESLRDRLRRERQLPLDDALQIGRNVAGALAYAHTHGVVHRDIKPENILLEDGHAIVADFGVARAIGEAGTENVTSAGMAVGTPAYMSPEQAAGDSSVDGRSDIYSLGCVLYEMLTGEPPFAGPTPRAIIAKRFSTSPPPLGMLRDSVPEAVEQAIAKAMARLPADRFQTAGEFARVLSPAGAGTSWPSARSAGAERVGTARGGPADGRTGAWEGRGRRLTLPAGVAVAALAIAAGLWAVRRSSHAPAAPVPDEHALAVLPFRVSDPGLALWREGLVDLFAIDMDGAADLRTIHPRTALSRWHRAVQGTQDADEGMVLEVARQLGARYALTGSLIGGGGRVRLAAELYDVRRREPRRAQVEGSSDSIPTLVDRLSVQLLRAGVTDSRGVPRPGLERLTTTSLPALKAYLAGEQKFRRARAREAIPDFRRAVDADSTFALALYRLSAAEDWTVSPHEPTAGNEMWAAARLASRLPPRDALLLRGAWQLGMQWPEALRTLEELTRRYPDDAEAWFALGEAYFHLGEQRFVPRDRFGAALHKALELDPSFAPAYTHLVEGAFEFQDSVEARRLTRELDRIDSTSDRAVGTRVAYGLAWGDRGQRARAESLLRTASGDALIVAKHASNFIPEYASQSLHVAEAVASDSRHPLRIRLNAVAGQIWASFYRGRMRDAVRMSDSVIAMARGLSANDPEIAWATDPYHVRDRVDVHHVLLAARLYVAGFPLEASVARARLRTLSDSSSLLIRYQFGALAAAAGDGPELARWIAAFRKDATRPSSTDSLERLASERQTLTSRAIALGLDAMGGSHRGDRAAAIRGLRAATDTLRLVGWAPSILANLDLELGKLLLDDQRPDEAERYFARFATHRVFAPLAEFYLGRTAEARGDRDRARRHYERFVRWWEHADPELRPWWEAGREAVARLSGEPQGQPVPNAPPGGAQR